jgi:hypothetical protein
MLQGLKGVSLFLCASCRIMVSRRAPLIRRHLRSPYLKGPRFVGQVVRGALWAGPCRGHRRKGRRWRNLSQNTKAKRHCSGYNPEELRGGISETSRALTGWRC